MADEGIILKALGKRTTSDLLEVGGFTTDKGPMSILEIISATREHGGVDRVKPGNPVVFVCSDGYKLAVRPKAQAKA